MNTTLENPTNTTLTEEPAWLTSLRNEGKAQFDILPAPTARDERWRFASVGKLSIDGFAPAPAPSADKLAAFIERSNLVSDRAGQLVFADDAKNWPHKA